MKNTNKNNLSKELHSNLMLVSTSVAMICFVALMLIYMGMKNTALPEFTTSCSRVCAIVVWVSAAVMAYRAVKRKKSYLLEYVVYFILMGFGFMFMFNMPAFLYVKFHITNWATMVFRTLMVLTGLFFAGSVAIHGVLASKVKKK